jgi:hypothetical protein
MPAKKKKLIPKADKSQSPARSNMDSQSRSRSKSVSGSDGQDPAATNDAWEAVDQGDDIGVPPPAKAVTMTEQEEEEDDKLWQARVSRVIENQLIRRGSDIRSQLAVIIGDIVDTKITKISFDEARKEMKKAGNKAPSSSSVSSGAEKKKVEEGKGGKEPKDDDIPKIERMRSKWAPTKK